MHTIIYILKRNELSVLNMIVLLFLKCVRQMSRIIAILNSYPLLRGMVSYSIIWPTSAYIQQKIAGKEWGKNFEMATSTVVP